MQKLIENGFQTYVVKREDVRIQDRTWQITFPPLLFCYGEQPSECDNARNQIERGKHQVDLSRSPSWIAQMPDGKTFNASGNPYPPKYDERLTFTTDAYKSTVAVAHCVYQAIAKSECVTFADVNAYVAKHCDVALKSGNALAQRTLNMTRDAIRDLVTFNYVFASSKQLRESSMISVNDAQSKTKFAKLTRKQ